MLQKYITKLFLLLGIWITAQQYPVKLNPVLIPPYSVRLADYATSSEEKVRLQLLLTDLMQPSHQVNLRFSLEGASSSSPIAATNPSFSGMRPITIYPGAPLMLSNFDFRPLFELQNLVGINAAQYSRALPQGMYNFCFTAYDAINNQQLSQKSCAPIYLQNYDPPFLTLPANAEKVTRQNEFQNVIFQWMPRQEAPNTQYVFTLKEIWDTSINPTSAFLASRTLWQEKTNTRSIYYGMDKTALLEGKRYAWQVQAVSANQSLNGNIDPNNYNGVYQNNGLSEIFFFDYVRDCAAPIMLMAKNAGRGRVEIRWMMPNGQPQGLYNIQYRRRGSTGDWSEQKSYQETTFLTGLEDKTEYEYRVGSICGDVQQYEPNPSGSASHQNAYTYSQIQYFTTNSDDKNPSYQCGVMPDVDISNKTPLTGVLSPNQSFTAGDFVVSVIKASGNGGNYSGEGFIVVPYLTDTKVKVVFNNIQINSDKKLINGVVETTYDPKESAVSYVSTGVGELFGDQGIGYREVKYKVDHIEVVTTPPPGKIIIHSGPGNDGDSEGAGKEELPLGKDYEIKDEDGNIWYVDEKGNVTKGGKVAEGGASTSQNTDGVSGNGKNASLNAYTAKGVNMTWNASHSTYAYDDASKAVGKLQSEYPKVKDASGKDVYISYKAVVNKSSDTFEANVSFTDASLASQKVVFKTLENGKEIKANLTPGTETSASRTYTLQLEGTFSYATEQVIAVLMPKDKDAKQQVISSFNLVHLEPKTVDVSLVPLDNASASNLDTQAKNLNEIYKKVGVSFNVKKDGVLDVSSIVSGDAIETPDDKALSTYSQMQTSINNLYKGTDARYVLFVTNKKSSTGQNGYMRLNGQFGYIYGNAPTKTGAHELGHGAFKLEHPWSKYNSSQGATDLLMDYGTGTSLNHMDWKQINDLALKLYAFQGQSDGELAGGYGLSPNFDLIKTDSNLVTDYTDIHLEEGFIEGFTHNNKYFFWNGREYVTKSGEVYKNYVTSVDKKATIWLAYNHDQDCSVFKFIRSNYGELEQIIINKDKVTLRSYIEKIDKIKRPDKPKENEIYSAYFGCGNKKRSTSDDENVDSTSGEIKKQLVSLGKQFGENVEFSKNGKVYHKTQNGNVEEVQEPLSDEQINKGDWEGIEEQKIRTTIDSTGVVQIQSFGINSKNVKIAKGKTADLNEIASNILNKTNSFYREYNVTDLDSTPAQKGVDLNEGSKQFADGEEIAVNNNASFGQIMSEGYSTVKTLLKTATIEEKVYLDNKKKDVALHAPGLVTGTVEAGTTVVTDITSIGVMVYDLSTDKKVRQEAYDGMVKLKDEIGEDPKKMVPIFIDVITESATGITPEQWQKLNNENSDKGERSHLGSRAVVTSVKTVIAGSAFISKLPKITDDVVAKVKDVKNVIKTFVENPFDEFGKLKKNVTYKAGEFDYIGETDAFGRVESMSASELKLTEREKRLRHDPKTPDKEIGDHAGHLIADRFGGSPELDNLVSQLRSVNLSSYKVHENLWADAIDAGAKVKVEIKVIYNGQDLRPSGFKLDYIIDDEIFDIPIIPNN